MKRASFIFVSFLVLVGGPLSIFLSCSWALGHSHDHEHHVSSHRAPVPSGHALAEIHCSKPAHLVGPMLRPAGTTRFNPSMHEIPFGGSTLWAVLQFKLPGINPKFLLYPLPPPNLASRGPSYRLFLSVLQI